MPSRYETLTHHVATSLCLVPIHTPIPLLQKLLKQPWKLVEVRNAPMHVAGSPDMKFRLEREREDSLDASTYIKSAKLS